MKDKERMLRKNGTFNFASKKVSSELFQGNNFFDKEDLLQVKYEMLRAVMLEHSSIAQSCARFGLSRTAFYRAQEEFTRSGLSGMLPEKRGPKGPHKLKGELFEFLKNIRERYPEKNVRELLELVQEQFNAKVHPRTVSRALKKIGEKRGQNVKGHRTT
jgi:transposase